MPYLSPHELKNGSVLAEDAYNLDGNLLFESGTRLTERKIEILMMWGVEGISVIGDDSSAEAVSISSFSNSAKRTAEVAVQKRFKLIKSSHPVVFAIRELAILESARTSDHPQS